MQLLSKKKVIFRARPKNHLGKILTFIVAMKKVHLSREQRYTISVMYRQGCAQKLIALTIGKNKSVISRELKRNANLKGKYSFGYAQDMAELRKERTKKTRKLTPELKKKIITMIKEDFSPQQIEGRLKLEKQPLVSHKTIEFISNKFWR